MFMSRVRAEYMPQGVMFSDLSASNQIISLNSFTICNYGMINCKIFPNIVLKFYVLDIKFWDIVPIMYGAKNFNQSSSGLLE